MSDLPQEAGCLNIGMEDTEKVSLVSRALSVRSRVDIMNLLFKNNIMSVNEIAQTLSLPFSTASLHINILQEAKLISCERMSSLRGSMKMCSLTKYSVLFRFADTQIRRSKEQLQTLPLGAYSRADDIAQTCGIASHLGPIGPYNNPRSFFLPARLEAQVLWFQSGSLCYDFSSLLLKSAVIEYIELSFEACTQATYSNPVWKTELQVLLNGRLLGTHTCGCDSEGRRGKLNPAWWPDVATQHGELLKWRITDEGSYLQDEKISSVTLNDLALTAAPMISAQILVPADSEHHEGLNLFGSGFGDYNQAINLLIGYHAE